MVTIHLRIPQISETGLREATLTVKTSSASSCATLLFQADSDSPNPKLITTQPYVDMPGINNSVIYQYLSQKVKILIFFVQEII
jgi:hypothetical protein